MAAGGIWEALDRRGGGFSQPPPSIIR